MIVGSTYRLIPGDAGGVLARMRADSIDALVTDPPAGISFMGKEWDSPGAFVERRAARENTFDHVGGNHNPENNADKVRDARGRGRRFREAMTPIFTECLRVMKPGAHGLVWALPRTSHWTATALEDAGFEVRDIVMHLFGTGFPKSLNVSKAIDAAAGAERLPDGTVTTRHGGGARSDKIRQLDPDAKETPNTIPATAEAIRFDGWGTALKPAAEHWILVRKPLDGTVAANVLATGCGGLNIDGCRIGTTKRVPASASTTGNTVYGPGMTSATGGTDTSGFDPSVGRWPANLTLDEEAAVMLDAQAGNGGASRFFYVAKAPRSEREAGLDDLPPRSGGQATDREDGSAGLNSPRAGAGRGGGVRNHHPTVKNVALMRWLCRLITPPGGIILDPFMGSGSTGIAALAEGFKFVGIEREPDYMEIARRRIEHAVRGG